jgi:DNA-binding NarL/FixJ family response regulator
VAVDQAASGLALVIHLCQGKPNKVIAQKMGISEGTVRKSYVSTLLEYFKVARRTELILEISRRQIRIPPPRAYQEQPSA